MSTLRLFLSVMNPKLRLLASIAITAATVGFGSLVTANLANHHRSNSTLAQNIIKSQQAEIAQMTQWQQEWSASK